MNEHTKKTVNLMVHLARIDGEFHRSERLLIKELIEKEKLGSDGLLLLETEGQSIDDIDTIDDKGEILYLCLKLIQADDKISDTELAYCKDLAVKLGYKEGVIEHFVYDPLPDRNTFDKDLIFWI